MTNKQVSVIGQFKQTIKKYQPEIAKKLPSYVNVENFIDAVIVGVEDSPQRDKLLEADRASLFNACKKSAKEGLLPDSVEGYFSPFWDKNKKALVVQFIPMAQGLVKQIILHPDVDSVSARVVYENDTFEHYEDEVGEHFIYRPNYETDRGKPKRAYAIVRFKSGGFILSVLSKERILQIAEQGNNSFQYDPEKGKNWEEWWKKTAIRNVAKYSPKVKSYGQNALISDEKVNDTEFSFDDEPEAAPKTEKPKTKRKTKAEQVVKPDVEDPEIIDAEIVEDDLENEDIPI